MPLVVLLLAVFVNFSNDYFDHRSGLDKIRFEDKNAVTNAVDTEFLKKLYWEGNPFDNGLVTEKQGKVVMLVLVVLSIILAIPIILYGGLMVIIFGAIGLFLSYFYTAPPLDLGARGLGEADVAVSFFMLVFCSFYIGTINMSDPIFSLGFLDTNIFVLSLGIFDEAVFVFAIIIGIMLGNMRLTDSFSAYESHMSKGERSIVVRLGLDRSVKVSKAIIASTYVLAALMVFLNPVFLLLFLTLPLTVKAWKTMTGKDEDWRLKCPPLFFGMGFLMQIFFIAAIAIIKVFEIGSIF
jgi:1,4-dihydroxy-2-naphthoate octaprenyltransferase